MKARSSPSRRRRASVPSDQTPTPSRIEPLERRTLLSGDFDLAAIASAFLGVGGDGEQFDLGSIFALDNDHNDGHGNDDERHSGDDDDGDDGDDDDNSGPGGGSDDDDRDDDDDDDRDEEDRPRPPRGKVDAAPTAQIVTTGLTSRTAEDHTVTVTYADDKKIRVRTIDEDDITVTGPGGARVDVTDVSVSPDRDNDTIVATYRLDAPGGAWDASDNGGYAVTLNVDEVFDNKGHAVAAGGASFQVGIVGATDNAAPSGAISVDNISSAGGDNHRVRVTYSDDVGVNTASIGPADLAITGPTGAARTVRSVSIDANADGTLVTATYTFGAPGGSWDTADNGTYTIALNADQVRDRTEKGATAPTATFTVNVAAPQPVDPGFGAPPAGGGSPGTGTGGSTGGAITTSFIAEAVVAQPDGKLLVAGRQGSLASGTSQGVIQRFNEDGTVDTTFGNRGRVVTAAGSNDAYYAIALNAAGQILVSGSRGGDVLVSRYNADGTLDTTYARGGSSVTDFGAPDDAAFALGVAADGSAVAAGGPNGDIAFARFLPSGALDPGFGQGGIQMFDLGSPDDTPGAVAFMDNKVVIVGTSGGKVAVVRVRNDGEADETFSGDGLLLLDVLAGRTDANFRDRSTAAAVQPDGKLLLANRSADGNFAVARLNSNGALDTSFGAGGVATVDFGGTDDDADAVIVQDTGEILVIGTTNAGGVANTAVAALDTSGALIGSFGTGGKLTLSPDASAQPRALHAGSLVLRAFGTRTPDGRVVIGTTNANGGGSNNGGTPQAPNNPDATPPPTKQQSSLRRLNVPGTRSAPQGQVVGTFGTVDGRRKNLLLVDDDGTLVTFSASRGGGTVYKSGDKFNLTVSDGAVGATVNIRTSGGGDGRIKLGDVVASGNLRGLVARTADLSGTLYASGSIGRLMLGNVTGTIAAAGSIASVALSSMTGARMMAGAGLGADGKLGGANADADSYTAATIGTVRVAGAIEASTISAGLDPVDGTFNNEDDRVTGGEQSVIRAVSAAGGADATSRFIAGKVVTLRLPGAVNVDADDRVRVMG